MLLAYSFSVQILLYSRMKSSEQGTKREKWLVPRIKGHDLDPTTQLQWEWRIFQKSTWNCGGWGGRALEKEPGNHSKHVSNGFHFPICQCSYTEGIKETGRNKRLQFFLSSTGTFSMDNLDQVTAEMTDIFLTYKTGWLRKKRRNWQNREDIRRADRKAKREQKTPSWIVGSVWLERPEQGREEWQGRGWGHGGGALEVGNDGGLYSQGQDDQNTGHPDLIWMTPGLPWRLSE